MEALRLADGRAIPDSELRWSFARAHGPGGQGVNTTDSAARLGWDIAGSAVLSDSERDRLLRRLHRRLTGTVLSVTAREHRSQWANRKAAAQRLIALVDAGLAPNPPARRPTAPGAAAKAARVSAKRRRSEVKRGRRTPDRDA